LRTAANSRWCGPARRSGACGSSTAPALQDRRAPARSARALACRPPIRRLIAEGKVVRLDPLVARQAQKIGGEPASRPVPHLQPATAHAPLEVDENRPRLVVRRIVRGVDAPVCVALRRDRPELFIEKKSASARAEQDCHPVAGISRCRRMSRTGTLSQYWRWRFYFHAHIFFFESSIQYSKCHLPIWMGAIRRNSILL